MYGTGAPPPAPHRHERADGGNRTRDSDMASPRVTTTLRPQEFAIWAEGFEPPAARFQTEPSSADVRPDRGGQGSRTLRSPCGDHPLSRRAPGTGAGRTLQNKRSGRGGSRTRKAVTLGRFRGGCHRPLACPSIFTLMSRMGIEPTFGRIKSPLQSQRLLPARGPALRNRTGTFRVSNGCAHQLRQGGMSRGAGNAPFICSSIVKDPATAPERCRK